MGMQTKFSFSALKIDLSMFWNILVFFLGAWSKILRHDHMQVKC